MYTNEIIYCLGCHRAVSKITGVCDHCHKAYTHIPVNLEYLYFLESYIPQHDGAHEEIMNEIERLEKLQSIHDEAREDAPGIAIVVVIKDKP